MPHQPISALNLLSWEGHKSALWWIGVIYRKPKLIREATACLKLKDRMLLVAKLNFIASLYTAPFSLMNMYFFYFRPEHRTFSNSAYLIIIGTLLLSSAVGFLFSALNRVKVSLDFIFIATYFTFLSFPFMYFFGSPIDGVVIGATSAAMIEEESKSLRSAILFGLFIGVITAIASIYEKNIIGVFLTFSLSSALFPVLALRLSYHPFAYYKFWLWSSGRFYRWHPVAWDDCCYVPFAGLDKLLIKYYERDSKAAEIEIERLINTYNAQRIPALKAKASIIIRRSSDVNLEIIDAILSKLPEGNDGFLSQTRQIKDDVSAIARAQRDIATRNRPLFRSLFANQLVNRILAFQGTVSGFEEPLATELRSASASWLERAQSQVVEADADAAQATRQLFRAGDPIDRESEAFVARWPVLEELERQVLLSGGCPGLLLYGRRRVGKSTILRGLEGLIPASVLPTAVSLQNPCAGTDVGHFCGHMRQRIAQRLGWTDQFDDTADLPALMSALTRANAELVGGDQRLLLALDEYEMLDKRIVEGAFPNDFLATLRESIQTHRRIVWMFAGSHHIDELSHPDWASHLISVRMVHVPMFSLPETRSLLTDPLAMSPLFSSKDDPRRPHIAEEFWGEGGIAWLFETAGGWPFFVQLLAEATVDEVNNRQATAFSPAWRRDLLDRAVQRGDLSLRQLLLGESLFPGEADYILGFAATEIQPPPTDRVVARSMLRRELVVVDEDDRWRLRIPLMRHWLVRNRHLL